MIVKILFISQGLTIIIDLGSSAIKAGFAQEDGRVCSLVYFMSQKYCIQ